MCSGCNFEPKHLSTGASLIAQLVKNLPAMQETPIWFQGREDLLEKGQATHSSILGLPLWLSWHRIRLQCRRSGFDPWVGKIPWGRNRLPTPVFWPGEFHGLHSPWGRKESDTIEWHSHLSFKNYFLLFLSGHLPLYLGQYPYCVMDTPI